MYIKYGAPNTVERKNIVDFFFQANRPPIDKLI